MSSWIPHLQALAATPFLRGRIGVIWVDNHPLTMPEGLPENNMVEQIQMVTACKWVRQDPWHVMNRVLSKANNRQVYTVLAPSSDSCVLAALSDRFSSTCRSCVGQVYTVLAPRSDSCVLAALSDRFGSNMNAVVLWQGSTSLRPFLARCVRLHACVGARNSQNAQASHPRQKPALWFL
eukprot:410288-Rhodomonas_salina.1